MIRYNQFELVGNKSGNIKFKIQNYLVFIFNKKT